MIVLCSCRSLLYLIFIIHLYRYLFCNYTATTEIYTYLHTLSLHYALPISRAGFLPLPRLLKFSIIRCRAMLAVGGFSGSLVCDGIMSSARSTVIRETFRSRATRALLAPAARRRRILSSSPFFFRPLYTPSDRKSAV